ncbi:hypothetical protein [Bacillus phage CP-51]|uniref:Uncharacterized protein n=1 Tax=Bacillus phage CP-51 TaxID=1391188 RepID=A0A068EPF6_9CAUD|nr:hypothetical protein OZ73_gp174 [Bacillus phage CP-51]AID50609.1 hypothetical protein [Bacillus phage CP-51]
MKKAVVVSLSVRYNLEEAELYMKLSPYYVSGFVYATNVGESLVLLNVEEDLSDVSDSELIPSLLERGYAVHSL